MAQLAAREVLIGCTETNFHSKSRAALRQEPRHMVGSQSSDILRIQQNGVLNCLEASPGLSRRLDKRNPGTSLPKFCDLKKNRGWGDWEVAAMSLVLGFSLLILENGVTGRRFLSTQNVSPPTCLPSDMTACSHLSVSQLLSDWPLHKWAGPAQEPVLMITAKLWPFALVAAVSPWLMSRRCLCSTLMLWGLVLPSFTLRSNS